MKQIGLFPMASAFGAQRRSFTRSKSCGETLVPRTFVPMRGAMKRHPIFTGE